MTNVPLLITSAVFPVAPFVAMDRVDDRLRHVLDAVKSWRLANPDIDIVICDGSGYDLGENIRAQLGTACRGIEVMCFVNSQEVVREKGKGYGEGEILLHALHYSETLRNSSYFAKCTGKLFVSNYRRLASRLPNEISIDKYYKGRYSLAYESCDTRFYIANRDFYMKYLSICHESVNDYQGRYLEEVFAEAIKRSGAKFTDFKVKPLIEGYSGTKNFPLNTVAESRKRGVFRLVRRLVSSLVPDDRI